MSTEKFDRTKIYEKLDYQPQPSDYHGQIPWRIQQQISATNGIHYAHEVGKLKEYPIPDIPIRNATNSDQLFLDIGQGWGRWLIAAGRKNYIPVGVDLRLEFCETSLIALRDNNINGYSVVADLKNLPFKNDVFDQVWSFSVIQHTHKERMLACLNHIKRILKPGGRVKLEFPNKDGLRNRFGPVKKSRLKENDYNSWVVRYYSIREYKRIFQGIFGSFSFTNHSFLGIGILPNDLRFVRDFKSRIGISLSLFLSFLTRLIPGMKYFSDSVYIESVKKQGDKKNSFDEFFKCHRENPGNNLNLISLLQCPITGEDLRLSLDGQYLETISGLIKYPLINNIPILIASEAIRTA